MKTSTSEYDIQCQVGRSLILQINTVVKLTKQMRVEDRKYLEVLNRMRVDECTMEDYQLLRSLIIGQPGGIHSLADASWNNAPILDYRNEIRTELNNRAVFNKCREMNCRPIVCLAQDKIRSKIIDEEHFHQLRHFLLFLSDNKTQSLPMVVFQYLQEYQSYCQMILQLNLVYQMEQKEYFTRLFMKN